jgi:hypothetical protein
MPRLEKDPKLREIEDLVLTPSPAGNSQEELVAGLL